MYHGTNGTSRTCTIWYHGTRVPSHAMVPAGTTGHGTIWYHGTIGTMVLVFQVVFEIMLYLFVNIYMYVYHGTIPIGMVPWYHGTLPWYHGTCVRLVLGVPW